MVDRLLIELPDRVILVFLAAVLAVGPLATFGQFRPVLVVPLFVLLVVVSWRLYPAGWHAQQLHGQRSHYAASGALAACIIAIGWLVFNVVFRSQMYLVIRDPAIYTMRSLWLVHHSSPNVAIGGALRGGQGVTGVFTDAGGFPHVGQTWQAQGSSLVPALLATAGWAGGDEGVLGANVLIGAVCLLVVYALGRRVVGPVWALAPVLALGVSMPLAAFSRGPYTEPTALILGLGGVVLLWMALETDRLSLGVVAGLSLGATFLARPDGLLFASGATVALGVCGGLSRHVLRRRRLRLLLLCYLAGVAGSVVLALLDFARNSSVYEASLWPDFKPLLLLSVVVGVLAIAVSFIPGREAGADRGLRRWLDSGRLRWAQLSVALIGIAFVVMVLRPLFWTAHVHGTSAIDVSLQAATATKQQALGLPIDGTRTYDERTMSWLSWYYSWPVVCFAAGGAMVLTWWAWRRRDPRLVILLIVVGGTALLYLNRASITPDQIWAMRRFLPIIVPIGLILAAALPFAMWQHRPKLRPLSVLFAAVLVIAPTLSWRQTRTLITAEYAGAKAFTASTCAQVRGHRVIVADIAAGGTIILPTLKISCGVDALLLANATPAALLAVRANWGESEPVMVITFVASTVPWRAGTAPTVPTVSARFKAWDEPLLSRPLHVVTLGQQLFMGTLGDDGHVDPVK